MLGSPKVTDSSLTCNTAGGNHSATYLWCLNFSKQI